MKIELYNQEDQDLWDKYVLEHENGTVFHLSAWNKSIDKTFSHEDHSLVAFEDGDSGKQKKITGILPLTRVTSKIFGDYFVSIPFAEVGGSLSDSQEIAVALMNRATQIAEDCQCDYLEMKNRKKIEGLQTKDLYYHFSKELCSDLEDNLLAIPRKSRAAVRKGIKSDLIASFDNNQLDVFYEIIARSYHNLGTPVFTKKLFKNLLDNFKNDAEILVVRTAENVPIAAVMTFYFRDRIMPYYAGSLPDFRRFCPNDFMYWELLKHGWEKGYKVFDLGRSKIDTGSFSFKKHWGFEAVPLFYQYRLVKIKELPNLSPSNPKYAKKIEMWQRMPFFMTKLIGPLLSKYLA